MKLRLVFQKTEDDKVALYWVEAKTFVINVPDEYKDYHLTGAEEVRDKDNEIVQYGRGDKHGV